jgi:hypothetical protein
MVTRITPELFKEHLSNRAITALTRDHVLGKLTTLEELTEHSVSEFLATPGLGRKSLNEIHDMLEKHGLGLRLTTEQKTRWVELPKLKVFEGFTKSPSLKERVEKELARQGATIEDFDALIQAMKSSPPRIPSLRAVVRDIVFSLSGADQSEYYRKSEFDYPSQTTVNHGEYHKYTYYLDSLKKPASEWLRNTRNADRRLHKAFKSRGIDVKVNMDRWYLSIWVRVKHAEENS